MQNAYENVFCADIGSIVKGNFGWADNHGAKHQGKGSIEKFAAKVSESLASGQSTAVGFECPLFVPLRPEPKGLLKKREEEENRSWSGGAGPYALVAGLVEIVWILERVRKNLESTPDFALMPNPCQILFWEAFVSGSGKGDQNKAEAQKHAEDAYKAVKKFQELSAKNFQTEQKGKDRKYFSLIGAALLRAGWGEDLELLKKPCLFVKV